MNRCNNTNNNMNDDIIVFYVVPYISDYSINKLILGGNSLGPYGSVFSDFQVRFFGLIGVIIWMIILNNVLIKWPKEYGGKHKMKIVIKTFFKSIFLPMWMLLIIVSFIYEIYKSFYLKILYFIMIGICFYFQREFIKTEKRILDL